MVKSLGVANAEAIVTRPSMLVSKTAARSLGFPPPPHAAITDEVKMQKVKFSARERVRCDLIMSFHSKLQASINKTDVVAVQGASEPTKST